MLIEDSLASIEKLFNEYKKEFSKLESIESFFLDMNINPSKFSGINCPISDTNFGYLRYMLIHFYAFKIYIELESMYKDIILDFDPSFKTELYNINISSFINRIKSNCSKGCKLNPLYLQSIIDAPDFNSSYIMASILSIIKWRGKNAHHTLGSHNINLDELSKQFRDNKNDILKVYLKLTNYLNELQDPNFKCKFEEYTDKN